MIKGESKINNSVREILSDVLFPVLNTHFVYVSPCSIPSTIYSLNKYLLNINYVSGPSWKYLSFPLKSLLSISFSMALRSDSAVREFTSRYYPKNRAIASP